MDRFSTKDTYERESEEAERLVRDSPKVKPPRHDRRREEIQSEKDPDTDSDPDLKGDPDLSLNYKTIGRRVARDRNPSRGGTARARGQGTAPPIPDPTSRRRCL